MPQGIENLHCNDKYKYTLFNHVWLVYNQSEVVNVHDDIHIATFLTLHNIDTCDTWVTFEASW